MGDVGTHNPWRDGGCVQDAPTNVSATAVGSGKLTVSWQGPPLDDGGPPASPVVIPNIAPFRRLSTSIC